MEFDRFFSEKKFYEDYSFQVGAIIVKLSRIWKWYQKKIMHSLKNYFFGTSVNASSNWRRVKGIDKNENSYEVTSKINDVEKTEFSNKFNSRKSSKNFNKFKKSKGGCCMWETRTLSKGKSTSKTKQLRRKNEFHHRRRYCGHHKRNQCNQGKCSWLMVWYMCNYTCIIW